MAALAADRTILAGDYADESGSVTLLVSDAVDRVQVSFVGYRTEVFPLRDQFKSVLVMGTLETLLNEVVVTSYRSEASRDVSGSYISVLGEYGYGQAVDRPLLDVPNLDSGPSFGKGLFPNPSAGVSKLRLPAKADLVNVYTVTGQIVLSIAPDAFATQVDLELPMSLPGGTYVVEAVGRDGFAEAVRWVVVR